MSGLMNTPHLDPETHEPTDWWLFERGPIPVGPLRTEIVLERIRSREIGPDALVCEVGGVAWRPIDDVSVFASALTRSAVLRRRFDESAERTIYDGPTLLPLEPSLPEPLAEYDEDHPETTVVDVPRRRSSIPSD
jgi:hypothetical protein